METEADPLPGYYGSSYLVLLGRPESNGWDGVVGDLETGCVTVTPPLIRAELTEDVLHAVLHAGLAEVTGRFPSSQVGPVQIEGVETLAVCQHRVKQAESLALLWGYGVKQNGAPFGDQ